MVPLAGIEPALLAELDFESSASTNSATGAIDGSGSIARRQNQSFVLACLSSVGGGSRRQTLVRLISASSSVRVTGT